MIVITQTDIATASLTLLLAALAGAILYTALCHWRQTLILLGGCVAIVLVCHRADAADVATVPAGTCAYTWVLVTLLAVAVAGFAWATFRYMVSETAVRLQSNRLTIEKAAYRACLADLQNTQAALLAQTLRTDHYRTLYEIVVRAAAEGRNKS